LALVALAGPRASDFERFATEIALLLCVLRPATTAKTDDAALVTALDAIWTPYALIMQAKGLLGAA
jgi:hypothetical protein